jgi:putative toxin-antitoxin system antitoxin component (TIGR02293 family)
MLKAKAEAVKKESPVPTNSDVESLLGLKAKGVPELLGLVRAGLQYNSLESFVRKTRFPREEAFSLVQISPRTLARRKEKGRLSPEESDRLVRAARIVSQTRRLFEGNAEAANRWLKSSQQALGGSTPLEYAQTEIGAREVEALIARLEHGVFS